MHSHLAETVAAVQAFRKRADDARRVNRQLKDSKTEVCLSAIVRSVFEF